MSLHDRGYSRGSGRSGGWSGPGASGAGDFFRRLLAFLNLSFPIGRYFGIRVRVHILFVLLVVFSVWPRTRLMDMGVGAGEQMLFNLRWMALLFGSVLLHEFGHCFGCRAVGGEADDILMWPLGGLAYVAPPNRPWAHFVTVICGPLVNVVLGAAAYIALLGWIGWDRMPVSLWPFEMWRHEAYWFTADNVLARLLADLFVVNYALLLFNLLLIFYPFDGGRLVQIGLWTRVGYGRSMQVATTMGMYGAGLVALVAIWQVNFLLLMIAVMGFVTCWRQRQYLRWAASEEPEFDPRFAAAYEAAEGGRGAWFNAPAAGAGGVAQRERKPGALARWRAARDTRLAEAQQRRAAEQEAEVNRILDKIRDRGLASLTRSEKEALNSATESKRGGG